MLILPFASYFEPEKAIKCPKQDKRKHLEPTIEEIDDVHRPK